MSSRQISNNELGCPPTAASTESFNLGWTVIRTNRFAEIPWRTHGNPFMVTGTLYPSPVVLPSYLSVVAPRKRTFSEVRYSSVIHEAGKGIAKFIDDEAEAAAALASLPSSLNGTTAVNYNGENEASRPMKRLKKSIEPPHSTAVQRRVSCVLEKDILYRCDKRDPPGIKAQNLLVQEQEEQQQGEDRQLQHLESITASTSESARTGAPPGIRLHDALLLRVAKEGQLANTVTTEMETSTVKWYHGSISLCLDTDDDFLSPLHCFVRRHCVEAFTANEEDVIVPRYGKSREHKIGVGQVGIRCLHCLHLPLAKRPERAQSYPSSLKNIYHAVETWQRKHALQCSSMPLWVRKSLMDFMKLAKSSAGGRRQYWADAAVQLGMKDTDIGLRFVRTPGLVQERHDRALDEQCNACAALVSDDERSSKPLVAEDDRGLVSQFVFKLMLQMEPCRFTEQDRIGGRSKVKNSSLGYPGFQCKHCRGKAGLGRYFPASLDALALANSDRNVYNHLKKCRKCPSEIQDHLHQLRLSSKNDIKERGYRKLFFSRMWKRLHGMNTDGVQIPCSQIGKMTE